MTSLLDRPVSPVGFWDIVKAAAWHPGDGLLKATETVSLSLITEQLARRSRGKEDRLLCDDLPRPENCSSPALLNWF